MDRLFIDSDIILDVALCREPHYTPSALLLSAVESGRVEGYTSSVIISNLYYIIRKLESHGTAIGFISKLRSIVSILPVDDRVIADSLESGFADFEDAIQHYTAVAAGMDYIITRNVKHYGNSSVKIHTPEEYLAVRKIMSGGDGTL